MHHVLKLTQWFSQLFVITAVPNVRAGFIELPVYLMVAKWPTVTDNPIANGAMNFESGLLPSQTPNTVKTRMNPRKNSNPKPCVGVTSVRSVWPKLLCNFSSKSDLIAAVPAVAPAHWNMMYSSARTRLILPVTNIDTVTAGLMCPPLTCPIAWKLLLFFFS